MPDRKISQLTAGGAAQATDEYVIARSGSNFKITGANVAAAATQVGAAGTTVTLASSATLHPTGEMSVGTVSPAYVSTNRGNVTIGGSGGGILAFRIGGLSSGYVYHSGTSLDIVNDTANQLLRFWTNGGSGATERWQISASGHFLAGADNSFDIGASGANRPRNVFVAGNITAGGNINISAGNVLHLAGAGGNTYLQESSGTLFLGAGGAGRVQVNASGNVGVGVTPSAWTISGAKAIQVGPFASLTSNNSGGQFTDVGHNIFGAYSYLTTAAASFYRQGGGQHAWHTAPSGTAGNAITFTQAMTLDASGNLGVGTASPNARLHVAGATPTLRIDQSSGVTATLDFANGSSSYAFVRAHSSTGELRYASGPSVAFGGFHAFYTDTVERWRMASAGHFLAGVDNTYDIGASGATRPRNVFVGTNVTVGTNTLVTDTANVRVGVGIAAPTQRLHVQAADTAAAPTILVNEAASSYEARLGVDSSGNGWVGTGNVANFVIKTNNTSRMVFNSGGGVILAGGALATSATSGFLYVRSCAGTPTGTPTTEGSAVPIVVDTTNHKLYFYSGGSWRDAGP